MKTTTHLVLDEFVCKEGWDPETQLELCLQFIDNQDDAEALREFLQIVATA